MVQWAANCGSRRNISWQGRASAFAFVMPPTSGSGFHLHPSRPPQVSDQRNHALRLLLLLPTVAKFGASNVRFIIAVFFTAPLPYDFSGGTISGPEVHSTSSRRRRKSRGRARGQREKDRRIKRQIEGTGSYFLFGS